MWVSVLVRKPMESGYYYYKGKKGSGSCGYAYYWAETGKFEFQFDVAWNHVADEHLYWLDETNIKFEEYE